MGKTHYDALGVDPQASPEKIKKRWRKLAFEAHPDRAESRELTAAQEKALAKRFKAGSAAWEVLGDPAARKSYDRELRKIQRRKQPPTAEEIRGKEERQRQREYRKALRKAEARRRRQAKLQEARRERERQRIEEEEGRFRNAQEAYLQRLVTHIKCKVGSYILREDE